MSAPRLLPLAISIIILLLPISAQAGDTPDTILMRQVLGNDYPHTAVLTRSVSYVATPHTTLKSIPTVRRPLIGPYATRIGTNSTWHWTPDFGFGRKLSD